MFLIWYCREFVAVSVNVLVQNACLVALPEMLTGLLSQRLHIICEIHQDVGSLAVYPREAHRQQGTGAQGVATIQDR